MLPLASALLLALQVPAGTTTPAGGDTVAYWQQRADYTIVARLDEEAQRLRATGTLTYVNNSPDTLRELYVHQYLNAFRPGSKWSAEDQREGRVRFQHLRDPAHGFERFTAPPVVNGVAAVVDYPGAPDSTVARITLPRALRPGDSITVRLAWEARPSSVPRRQGRGGRHWDFAQWYPRIAVYDRGGWQPNALIPAGEFYGEFGSFDVTTIVRDDQVLGATGVPVSGDPGWQRAHRAGPVRLGADAYANLPAAPDVEIPRGHRAVRWIARDVHHFGWSASPDYMYEGGVIVRPARARFPTWDTVSVHVLYRPGDEATWGNLAVVNRTIAAMRFLEDAFGAYGYPQVTNLHRLESGGTEFPMMMMNGSPSQGLILHEGAHIYAHGMLANNEWRSGWMDEGLASYLTNWAQGLTLMTRAQARATEAPPLVLEGYRGNAQAIARRDSAGLAQLRLVLQGRAQPIGTSAGEFSEFAIYNQMIYSRAELMFSQLHDALGDTAFTAFLHDYYDRWAFKHVDEQAMRASAERAHGRTLGWFFDQWVDRVGLLDYGLLRVEKRRQSRDWLTRVQIERLGDYRHPMPVGVRTVRGWTIVRGNPLIDAEQVEITTADEPLEVRIDPHHTTADWDRRNDVVHPSLWGSVVHVPDWPFLDQSDRERRVAALSPIVWYSDPQGLTLGVRSRSSYLTHVDRLELGAAMGTRTAAATPDRPASSVFSLPHVWARAENLSIPWLSEPLMGHAFSAARLDGIARFDWTHTRELGYVVARAPRLDASMGAAAAFPHDRGVLPERWEPAAHLEANARLDARFFPSPTNALDASVALVAGFIEGAGRITEPVVRTARARPFARLEAEARQRWTLGDEAREAGARFYGGASFDAPAQRALYAAGLDPMTTYWNHWDRPRGAILKQQAHVGYVPLGGPALRGYSRNVALSSALAANGEFSQRAWRFGANASSPAVWLNVFGDVALAGGALGVSVANGLLADAGVGVALRGRLFDRDVRWRLDMPLVVKQPALSAAEGEGLSEWIWPRLVFSLRDIW